MAKISVIIPTFNAEKTIAGTVKSVLGQSFSDLEVLVVNDGSTDSTLDVLSHIKDQRLKILTFPNGGVAESRNRGIQNATGQYLSFLDSDDLWKEDKLKEQLSALENHPEAAVAYSWNDYIDEDGKFVHNGWHFENHGDVYEALFLCCFIENGSNILLRKEALDRVGGFDSALVPTEDWDFYLRLAENYHFVCVPKVHVLYRIVSGSLSNHVLRMERSGVAVLENSLRRSPNRLGRLGQESFADYYSYLFYKAFKQATCRRHWLETLSIFMRGISRSPKLWNLIAKRRVLRAINGFVLNS